MRHRKRGEQGRVLMPTSGEHCCDSSEENGCQQHHDTQAFSSLFQPTHLYWGWIMVQLLHLVLECTHWWCGPNAGLVRILPCMADLFWTLEWEECVCLGWTQNRPFASFFEPILNSTQTCLVHPDCRWASLLKFHLPNTWRMFDRHAGLIRT